MRCPGVEGKAGGGYPSGAAAAFLRRREATVPARPGVLHQGGQPGVAGQHQQHEAAVGRFQGARHALGTQGLTTKPPPAVTRWPLTCNRDELEVTGVDARFLECPRPCVIGAHRMTFSA